MNKPSGNPTSAFQSLRLNYTIVFLTAVLLVCLYKSSFFLSFFSYRIFNIAQNMDTIECIEVNGKKNGTRTEEKLFSCFKHL